MDSQAVHELLSEARGAKPLNGHYKWLAVNVLHWPDVCQLCGSATQTLLHHLDHDKTNNDPATNWALWCRSCHTKHHHAGRKDSEETRQRRRELQANPTPAMLAGRVKLGLMARGRPATGRNAKGHTKDPATRKRMSDTRRRLIEQGILVAKPGGGPGLVRADA